jgi:hypothetical protein
MNPEHGRAALLSALGVTALALLGIFVSKRASTDIAAAVIAALAFGYAVVIAWPGWQAKHRARKSRHAPWTMFSQPHPTDDAMWEVGVRRRHDDVDLDRRVLSVLRADQSFEITVAEEDAKTTATRWTENKVNM